MTVPGLVEFAHNFERNLDEIERFLIDVDAPDAFAALLSDLFDRVIPNLAQFPELGADFLARRAASVQGSARIEALRASRSDIIGNCPMI